MKKKWLCSLYCLSSALLAHPQDPSIIQGSADFRSLDTDQLQIQTSHKAIIEWKSFSNTPNQVTEFVQPSKTSAVLNRVTSGLKSEILGQLRSNGRVYLVNPAGILIGKSGVVQTNGFVASTLNISNQDFLEEKDNFLQQEERASVTNLGKIKSEEDVALLGGSILQEGQILAPKSRVFLGAGNSILFQPEADIPLYIRQEPNDTGTSLIENTGFIQAKYAELASLGKPHQIAISHTGHIDALHVTKKEGRVFLHAERGTLLSSGLVQAATSVAMAADTVDLHADSRIKVPSGKVSLQSNKMMSHAGTISAKTVSIYVKEESALIHTGNIEASRKVTIQTPKLLNSGTIKAQNGGSISIDVRETAIETSSALLSATQGSITHRAGTFFSSGRYEVGTTHKQGLGGTINIFADQIHLVDARLDATAPYYPGSISVGILHEKNSSSLFISPTTQLHHHATQKNRSGNLQLAPQFQWPQDQQIGLCATLGGDCTFTSIGEFINPNITSSGFGTNVQALSTGNVVITNPTDDFAASDAGAVYLFNGTTGALISTLTGSSANDQIGSGGVALLTNGNYVVGSSNWDNPIGPITNVGAATWGSGTTGVTGTVSAANSLIGTTASDQISLGGITTLTNGNYVVRSFMWTNSTGPASSAGAATWGNGSTGISGTVSAANSLIGSTTADLVSNLGVIALTNGNYVVRSANWDNPTGPVVNVGAATWGNGSTGTIGTISAANSLIGTTANDQISSTGLNALTNGNYIVSSSAWSNPTGPVSSVGAATWGNGSTGTTGTISAANSLIGTTASDQVSNAGIVTLANGNYVVRSVNWDNPIGPVANVGAATWGNGSTGTTGTVSAANSLIGTTLGDQVAITGTIALTNGNYVVASRFWNNPIGPVVDVGAVTWGNGSTGTTGTVSAANSLIGTTASDQVSSGTITALTNGNYVVRSPSWDNPTGPIVDVGAATWGNGSTGTIGTVSATNSLIGTTASDQVCSGGVTALTNGNYVVKSPNWDNPTGPVVNVGAATWGNGSTGITGTVSAANSLIGGSASDQVSSTSVTALTDGNYVVSSTLWDNPAGPITDVGAATWGNGTTGTTGTVSAINSLIGSSTSDNVSNGGIVEAGANCYAVVSSLWNNLSPAATDAGAVTLGSSTSGITGTVSSSNSFVRETASTGLSGVVYSSAASSLIMPFKTEGNGRVFFQILSSVIPSTTTSPHVPSRGLADFRLSLSETFQEWGPFFLGGVLAEDIFAPCLTYKNVEHREYPSLIREKNQTQDEVIIKKEKRRKFFGF